MNDKHYVVVLEFNTEVHSENEHGFYDTDVRIVGVASTEEAAQKVVDNYELDCDPDYEFYSIYVVAAPAI